MNDDVLLRIAALEAELASLKREVGPPADRPPPAPAAAPTGRPVPRGARAPVGRRSLLRSGGAAVAGAAGAVVGGSTAAGAQATVPAESVTFTPTGGIEAANVQAALAEVDAEKAALAGAAFTGPVTIDDARFKVAPFVDVRAHGAKGDGGTDDTAAIRAAIAAASAAGGGSVFLPSSRYRFLDEIVVPEGVDLWGAGGHGQAPAGQGTVLQAGAPAARLVFHGTGGQSGNFLVHGLKLAAPAKGLVYVDGVERLFTAMRVSDSTTDGLVVEGAQNCTFVAVWVAHHDRDGLVLDGGAGGNGFIRCEFGACARDSVVIRETIATGPFVVPTDNVFVHCIMERGLWQDGGWNGPNNSQLHVRAGIDNEFSHCTFALNHGTSRSRGLVLLRKPAAVGTTELPATVATFEGCSFSSDPATGVVFGIINRGAGAHFHGVNWFNCHTGAYWAAGSWGRVLGAFAYGAHNVRRWAGDTATWSNKNFEAQIPFLATLEPLASWGLRVSRREEAGFRFQVAADGAIQVGDGSGYTPGARWGLQADGGGWETPDDVYLNGGALTMRERTTTPADPASGTQAVVYVKADKLVVAFNQGGTMRYKYLLLTDTSVDWVHSTTPP